MTDREFSDHLKRIGNKDGQSFKCIYSSYFRLVYSSALAVTNNKAAAEDVTSEFFIKLWESPFQGYSEQRGGHKRWLAVCAKNLAVNYIRKFGRETLISDKLGDGEADFSDTQNTAAVSDTEERIAEKTLISDALSQLAETEREVIHLKHFCGYTLREISKILDIPQGTAAWRCRSGEKKLKKLLEEVQTV